MALVTNTVEPLADELVKLYFQAYPLYATVLGVPGYGRALPDPSPAAEADLRARVQDVAARLAAMTDLPPTTP